MHLALIFNHLDYLGARDKKGSGLGPPAFWSLSPPLSFFSLCSFFSSSCLLLIIAFFLVLSSPTHTFKNIREHHNNSYQVLVCSMIYSRFPVSLTSIELLLTSCSDGEMQGALKPLGTSWEGERRTSCDWPQWKSHLQWELVLPCPLSTHWLPFAVWQVIQAVSPSTFNYFQLLHDSLRKKKRSHFAVHPTRPECQESHPSMKNMKFKNVYPKQNISVWTQPKVSQQETPAFIVCLCFCVSNPLCFPTIQFEDFYT